MGSLLSTFPVLAMLLMPRGCGPLSGAIVCLCPWLSNNTKSPAKVISCAGICLMLQSLYSI